ncbi:MAG TPA: multidrug effflux MFS transporter, partial [Acetobacteraceae bacterium]|nr:multidrug effflux MFS transporter [Acetobacteraceae bacterium]
QPSDREGRRLSLAGNRVRSTETTGVAGAFGSLRVLVVLSALMAFGSVATDMYLPALPTLGAALRADPGQIEMTVSGYLVGFSLGQLLWGPVGDRHGRRGPIAVGLALFVIGSVGCALSGTAVQMTGWRVVQAVGASAGPVLARAMVRDLYPRERAAQVLSTLMLVMGIGPLLAPLLGGQILAAWSWQAIFWTLAGCGLLALVGLSTLPETLPRARRDPRPFGEALLGYVALARSPTLLGYALPGAFFYGGLFAHIAGTPFAYIDYHRVPAGAYGLLFGINVAGMMAANLLNARLVTRLGADRILRLGTGGAALAGVVLALDARFGWGGLAGLVAPLFLYVSMLGFIVANSVAGALAAFPHRAGAASALLGAMHYGAGMLSTAMVGWFADGTPWTMGWIVGAGGIGSLLAAMLLVRRA